MQEDKDKEHTRQHTHINRWHSHCCTNMFKFTLNGNHMIFSHVTRSDQTSLIGDDICFSNQIWWGEIINNLIIQTFFPKIRLYKLHVAVRIEGFLGDRNGFAPKKKGSANLTCSVNEIHPYLMLRLNLMNMKRREGNRTGASVESLISESLESLLYNLLSSQTVQRSNQNHI